MTPEAWQRVKAVFDVALSLPPTERPSFLDSACGADVALRTEVDSLLSAASGTDSFLGTPPQTVTSPIDHPHSLIGPGQTIGRYRVVSHLGAGGMGEVYLAQDPRLGRRIALKLLPRELSHDPARLQRFEREARAASQLAHPNVCVIHEIGDTADERRFIAMEYVEGESLRQVLERHQAAGTRMPLAEAIDIALQVAAGLGAAHAAGIVHRDVKPENVMRRPDGLVKVLDFGLAKLVEPSEPGAGTSGSSSVQTEAGTVLGTVLYMSPEQARALPLNAQTDVWSLGVVLYELLSGQPPFEGETAADVMVSILDRDPPPLTILVPELPGEIQHVIRRALQKEQDARYPSMRELESDLKHLREGMEFHPPRLQHTKPQRRAFHRWRAALAVSLMLSVLLGGAALYRWQRGHRVVRLAVLPFDNVGDSADAYFSDGMTDAVRGKLSALRGLQVTARSTSSRYRATTKTPEQIGQELGVQFLLTATVRWQRAVDGTSRVQVTPELVRVASASTIWQRPFERALTLAYVFEVQADIAGRVAEVLQVALGDSARQQLAEKPTHSLAAYMAYLKGVEASQSLSDVPMLHQAVVHYEQAVALDSGFAQAWAQLSRVHSLLYVNSIPTPPQAAAARRAAEQALALAPNRAEGHFAMGTYYWAVAKDRARAVEEFEAAQKFAPNDVDLLEYTAIREWAFGRWEAALAYMLQIERLEPSRDGIAASIAEAFLWLRRYPEAERASDRALALAPSSLSIIHDRTMIHLAQGDLGQARAVIDVVPKEISPARLVAYFATYWDLYWVLSDAQQRILLQLSAESFDNDRATWSIVMAQTYMLRGDQALAKVYADSARIAYEQQLRLAPEDANRHALLGVALAYLGRKIDAVREGQRGVALLPIAQNPNFGPYFQHQLARIYIIVGEPEKALDQLEPLLKTPYYLSPGWLKIDPNFTPLRSNPRFQRLVAGGG